MVLPIGTEDNFSGIKTCQQEKHGYGRLEDPTKFDVTDPPKNMADKKKKLYRNSSEQDTSLEKHLEGEEPTIKDIKKCIRKNNKS